MQNDDKANIEEIMRLTGDEKIYYLGYSQGSTQMLYALEQDSDWFSKRLHKVVMLAPCLVRYYPNLLMENKYMDTLATFRDNGIYALYGPNWEEDWRKICDIYDVITCALYASETISVFKKQPISVKAE